MNTETAPIFNLSDTSLSNTKLSAKPNTVTKSDSKPNAGLAPLLLTVTELIRQLMEAQVIRRMERGDLTDEQLDHASDSLQKLAEQVVEICKIFDIEPASLNLDLGEAGTLLPKEGGYYPGQPSAKPTLLELLDRLLNTGIVVQGEVDLGLANLDLVHAKLQLVLTSRTLV
jgi:hypothetical protein